MTKSKATIGGAKHSLNKIGIGLKKKVTQPASKRTTDRSFVMDDLQKKSLVDVVNSRPCMYCSNSCNNKYCA